MLEFLNTFLEWLKNILAIGGPVIVILFTLAVIAGLVKWSYRTKDWIKEVSRNPVLLVLWLLLAGLGIYFFYKYGLPLLR